MRYRTNKLQEVFLITYRKILEMEQEEITQLTISSSTGHLRDKIKGVVNQAKVKA